MEKLRRLRTERGLSQARLAARAELDPSTVNQIERGAREASPATLRKLAEALDVGLAELLEDVSPKADRRSSLEPSLLNGLEDERHAGDTEVIADYERIVREHRIAWRDALNALAEPWEERIASGAFDRGAVDQFFADVAALSLSVSRALSASVEESLTSRKYKAPPTRADVEEMEATAIGFAAARLLDVGDAVYAAAAEKFSASDLEQLRRKRDEARRALGRAA